jgi:small subunit ribosomal protein S29
MASPSCWRCLARPSVRLFAPVSVSTAAPGQLTPAVAAPFTSAARLAATKDDGSRSRHIRSGKNLVIGKKKRTTDRGRPVEPGERKAFRKRIQLSNNNAIEVKGLPELTAQNISDPEAVGSVVSLPGPLVDQLRTIEAFKSSQRWGLFRSPHVLIRGETVELVRQFADSMAQKGTTRMVLTGDRGSGKSMLGLQTMAAGLLNGWIVIHVPEGA